MPFKKFYLKSANLATMLASIKLDSLFAEKRHKGKFKQNQISFTIKLEDTDVEVIQKKIKNLNLRVSPPEGKVRISAPLHMSQEKISKFAVAKLDWIRKQQQRILNKVRPISDQYLNNETHFFGGNSYPLRIIETNKSPFVELINNEILLNIQAEADTEKKRSILNEWYQQQLLQLIPPLINKWEIILNVSVENFYIRRMKTRWGSCTPKTRRIRFNLELAKKSTQCLEYIVVHELVHLLEASHNNRFKALMNQFYPDWKLYRKELHSLPIAS